MFDSQFGQEKIVRLEISHELCLARKNEQKGRAFGPDSCGSAYSMDVIGVGCRSVVLQDPVHLKIKRDFFMALLLHFYNARVTNIQWGSE